MWKRIQHGDSHRRLLVMAPGCPGAAVMGGGVGSFLPGFPPVCVDRCTPQNCEAVPRAETQVACFSCWWFCSEFGEPGYRDTGQQGLDCGVAPGQQEAQACPALLCSGFWGEARGSTRVTSFSLASSWRVLNHRWVWAHPRPPGLACSTLDPLSWITRTRQQ